MHHKALPCQSGSDGTRSELMDCAPLDFLDGFSEWSSGEETEGRKRNEGRGGQVLEAKECDTYASFANRSPPLFYSIIREG